MQHHEMKLGRLSPRPDQQRRLLLASRYLDLHKLPEPPPSTNRAGQIAQWGMYANDRIGDCAVAAPAHLQIAWSTLDQHPFRPTERQIVAAYSAISGYDPKTGLDDTGCVMVDVLNYWRKHGIAGRKIVAYLAVDLHNQPLARTAAWLFGGLYLGADMPLGWQHKQVWDAPAKIPKKGDWAPGSWGGHAFNQIDYDQHGNITVVTWGQTVTVTRAGQAAYIPECYAVLDPLWLGPDKKCPEGFSLEELKQDLAALGK